MTPLNNLKSPFCCYVAKSIPLAFDESMSYYEMICAFKNYLENTIIPAINNNNDAVTNLDNQFKELSNLFDELNEYVNNYFDNLDVQKEINIKLDEMASSGKFDSLLLPIINEYTENLNNIVNEQNKKINYNTCSKMNEIRKQQYDKYNIIDVPFEINDFLKQFKIYQSNDKQNYNVSYNINKYKNKNGNTYYLSPNGNDNNPGSNEQPWKSFRKIRNSANDGDTIIIKSGIYYQTDLPASNEPFSKSINIIGENNVFIVGGVALEWSKNQNYNNVYQATRTNVKRVIDARDKENNKYSELKLVDTIEDVSNTINSYTIVDNILYVNNGDIVNNDNIFVTLSFGYDTMSIIPDNTTGNNLNFYMENLNIIGNAGAGLYIANNTKKTPSVYIINCNFLFCGSVASLKNSISVMGANVFLLNCEAKFSLHDGFAYDALNGITTKAIEINCIGSNNGLNDDSNNGSTAHNGSKVIRINGKYFNNNGMNVADTHKNTESLNINCIAFDSRALNTTAKYDFASLSGGTKMYLYNCYSKCSDSDCNLLAYGSSFIYYSNTEFDTTGGPGTIINLDE